MKKRNIVIIILAILLIIPSNTYAASCSSYTAKNKCTANSSCEWKNKKCQKKSTTTTKKNTSTSTSNKNTSTAAKSNLKFCASTAAIWQIVGWIFLIVKILIPLILIIYGIIDFSKALISSKDDEVTKSAKKLAFRAISGVVIFFIPTIVGIVMGLISNFSDSGAADDFKVCQTCILNPSKCDTSKDVGKQ